MKLIRKIYLIALAFTLVTATSCTYDFPPEEEVTQGTADFTKLVTVGNSLTAGFMDGALYTAGQDASFPNILGTQMQLVGGGNFNQPDINSVNGVILSYLPLGAVVGRLSLQFQITLEGPTSPAPAPIGPGDYPMEPYSGELNNFGVPGMAITDFSLPGYGHSTLGNPYFARFASSDATTVQADVAAANGTFFTFWLGNNDVLGYALDGATGSTGGANSAEMTDIAVFTTAYQNAIDAMTATGASGVIVNIPNVTDIPHFSTVAWNAIPMDEATADATNAGFAAFNGGINLYNLGLLPGQPGPPAIKRDTIGFAEGDNGIVMYDSTLADLNIYGIPTMRQATSTDLITLTAGAVLGTLANENDPTSVIGVGVPLGEQYTLIEADQDAIQERVNAFNTVIAAEAGSDVVLLDINEFFADFAANGDFIYGSAIDASITPPFGAFSVDGIHLNQRGYAFIASLFIDKINESFGSNIPNVNPNNWAGNDLPALVQ